MYILSRWRIQTRYRWLVYSNKSKNAKSWPFAAVFQSTKSANSGHNTKNVNLKENKILQTDLATIELDRIRNFSIIAHIDHGKSTLADCMLEYVGAITKRSKGNDRVLDKLQVERERGITVKAQTASVIYEVRNKLLGNLKFLRKRRNTPAKIDFVFSKHTRE